MTYLTAAKQKPHGTKDRFQWIHTDKNRDNHRPANENRDPIFETVAPAPQPMPSPKNSEHDNARNKSGHVLESGQKRFDIVRDLLRSDHQHGDCEGEGCVDERFQAGHLHTTQTKSAEPRQRIQVRP